MSKFVWVAITKQKSFLWRKSPLCLEWKMLERKLDQNPHYLVWNGGSPFYSGDLVFHKSKS